MKVYQYFSLETDERLFVCSETGETGINHEFVLELDKLREACGFPFHINSGYRSPKHSKEAVKEKPGEHTRGAADIAITNGLRRYILVKKALELGFTGIGVAETFVHVDRRSSTPVIWTY
jgi:uncharacterized protein YcbK (DUF882 family)